MENLEVNTLIYHLNKQAIQDNKPFIFTNDILIPKPFNFTILSQKDNIISIKSMNNTLVDKNNLLHKSFKFGNEHIEILDVISKNKEILLTLSTDKILPLKQYELQTKMPIILTNGYRGSKEISGTSFETYKRINFSISINSDKNGSLYDEVLSFVELTLYRKKKSLPIYLEETKEVINNKYIFISTNVTTSNYIDNRDNGSRVFYVMIKTFKNI